MPRHPLLLAGELFCDQFQLTLLQLRVQTGLSQNKLSLRAGVAANTVGYAEKGDRCPKIDIYARMSLGMGYLPSLMFAQMEEKIGVVRLEGMMDLAKHWTGQDQQPLTEAVP